MAADSLIGGASVGLNETTRDILNAVLNDTQGSSIQQTIVGGAKVAQGLGANNETQGALVESTAPVVGTLNNGNFVVNVNLPANVGLAFEGLNQLVNGTAISNYLDGLIAQALPQTFIDANPTALEFRNSLERAVDTVLQGTGANANNVVRVVTVTDSTANNSAPKDIQITGATRSGNSEVVALNMTNVKPNNTVVLENIDNTVVVGQGAVRVSGNTSATVVGDSNNQVITGGGGSDTLVGGGGFDTLAGGAGADTFGFNSTGHYTLSDFSGAGNDRLTFTIPGITNLQQLATFVTSVDTQSQSGTTTYNFGPTASITLVGVGISDLTADMITFTVPGTFNPGN